MGVTLAEELPFAHVVESELAKKVCANCMKPAWERGARILSRCSRCKRTYYCNNKCQKNDWLNHKAECAFLLRVSPVQPEAMLRLMGRIIAKLQRVGDNCPAFNGRLFASLQTNAAEIRNDSERREAFVRYAEFIKDYLPEMPSNEQMFEIFCKLLTNTLSVLDNSFSIIGCAVYLGLSALDHSCNPEAIIFFDGTKAILRSIKDDITEYSNKIHIQYCDSAIPTAERRKRLKNSHFFVCNCELCQDVETDRKKYSLRCLKCNDGFCPYSPEDENPEICCKICGKKSEFILDDVKRLHQRLVDSKSWDKDLDKSMGFYHKCCEVFSSYNSLLCGLAKFTQNLAVQKNKYDTSAWLAEKILLFYRAFYPKNHPTLSIHIYDCAKAFILARKTECLPLLREAFEMVCKTHGAESCVAVEILEYIEELRRQI